MILRSAQNSFTGGEIGSALYGRTDIAKYASSCRKLKNFLVHPHGGISNRPGTYLIASTKYSTRKARVLPFIFSLDQAYNLEFGHNYIRFHTDGAQIQASDKPIWSLLTAYTVNDYVTYNSTTYRSIQNGTNKQPDTQTAYWTAQTAYEIYAPYTEDDLPDIRIESSADTTYITHPNFQTRVLSRLGNADWELTFYDPQDGPFMPENTNASISLNASALTGLNITLNATSATFNSLHVGSFWKLRHYIEGQSITVNLSSATTSSSIRCFTTWRIITHGTWTGSFKIEKSIDNGTTWTMLRAFSSANDLNTTTSGTEDPDTNTSPFLIRANMYSYSSGAANIDLTTDPFYQEGIAEVITYNSTTSVQASVIQNFGSISNTTSWSEGSWSGYRGYPRVSRFNQDRLVFAGTDSEPQTNWMTKTSNYTSFGRNIISLLDTDGITVNLPTRQLNAVTGLIALKKLIAFTSASEWSIGPVDGAILTPTTTTTEVQGYNGSSGVEPVVIGNQAVFIQGRGKVVRNIGFQLADDGFTGNDLNVLARHLFEGHSILEMAYQQEPDRIVWVLRDDGVLLSLTYMPEQEVVAWAQHETNGIVESICVTPADGYDELCLSVKRGTSRFIERMAQRMASEDPRDQYFVDCGISFDNPISITNITSAYPAVFSAANHGFSNGSILDLSDIEGMEDDDGVSAFNGLRFTATHISSSTFELLDEDGATVNATALTAYASGGYAREAFRTFTGFDHLNGFTVAILGNGEVYPEVEMAGGSITLINACSRLHGGLGYTSDLETLNIETGLRDGTLQGRKVKITNVTFRVNNFRGGWIGPNEDELYEAFTPARTGLGPPPVLYTGDLREGLGASFEDGGRVYYQQRDPLPVTINSLVMEYEVGDAIG